MSAVGSPSLENLKKMLLVGAKREAVSELFGEIITSVSKVENFALTEDKINSISSGFVRVNGSPKYYNGTSFAESCVSINAFITDEDKVKYAAKNITGKTCYADNNMSTKDLKTFTKEKAITKALTNYENKLKTQKGEVLISLIHQFKSLDSSFIPNTETFCVEFTGTIYPIEIEPLLYTATSAEKGTESTPSIVRSEQESKRTVEKVEIKNASVDELLEILNGVDGKNHSAMLRDSFQFITAPISVKDARELSKNSYINIQTEDLLLLHSKIQTSISVSDYIDLVDGFDGKNRSKIIKGFIANLTGTISVKDARIIAKNSYVNIQTEDLLRLYPKIQRSISAPEYIDLMNGFDGSNRSKVLRGFITNLTGTVSLNDAKKIANNSYERIQTEDFKRIMSRK